MAKLSGRDDAFAAVDEVELRPLGVEEPEEKADNPGEAGVVGGGNGPGGVCEGSDSLASERGLVIFVDLEYLGASRSLENRFRPPIDALLRWLTLTPLLDWRSSPSVKGLSDKPMLIVVGKLVNASRNEGMASVASCAPSLSGLRDRMPTIKIGIIRPSPLSSS